MSVCEVAEVFPDCVVSMPRYVSSAFSPALDEVLGELLVCFGKEGKLEVNYCLTQAYG
eukprot:COSAG05_NODE_49_length_24373_cov_16.162561_25_plen_58_part_00